MNVLVRPELSTASVGSSQAPTAAVGNSAPSATRPQSTYQSGKPVQTSGATSRILTDRGTEYCGNRESHEFALYLDLENIEHTRTRLKSPQTNGICERFHQTIQNEFYASAFRRKLYHSLNELQADVDAWMQSYNAERTHSGKYCYGKTPLQTFIESATLAYDKQLDRMQPASTAAEVAA
jgi:hypothetical protein